MGEILAKPATQVAWRSHWYPLCASHLHGHLHGLSGLGSFVWQGWLSQFLAYRTPDAFYGLLQVFHAGSVGQA